MKAICIRQFKQLDGILDKGDVVEIEVIKSTEDRIIWKKKDMGRTDLNGKIIFDDVPDIIQPAGSYEEWKFKSKNGHYYTGTGITNRIGNKTLFDIFEKL